MPVSAVQSGCVDFVWPPDGIARELVRIGRHPYVAHVDKKQKIYSRKTTAALPYLHAAADPQAGKATLALPSRQDAPGPAESNSWPHH